MDAEDLRHIAEIVIDADKFLHPAKAKLLLKELAGGVRAVKYDDGTYDIVLPSLDRVIEATDPEVKVRLVRDLDDVKPARPRKIVEEIPIPQRT
jgi:hypothetical protein